MSEHNALEVVGGDDWEIQAILLDETGTPYDLNTTTIKWVLLDREWKIVLDETSVAISIIDAVAGKCSIIIPSTVTTTLSAGSYTDVIRVIAGGVTSTLLTGPIYVTADPWKVAQTAKLRVVA